MSEALKRGVVKFKPMGEMKGVRDLGSPYVSHMLQNPDGNDAASIKYCPFCGKLLPTKIGRNFQDVAKFMEDYEIPFYQLL